MKFWCCLGMHHFVACKCNETALISSHENAQSIQKYLSSSTWEYECIFCEKRVIKNVDVHRNLQFILYVPFNQTKKAEINAEKPRSKADE